jgi:Trk K+ transport system NAD-binding subunit
VIIAGFGRFGQIVSRVLRVKGVAFTALDSSQTHVDFVRRFGNEVFYGDASRLDLLRAAGAASAQFLVLAIDDAEASTRTAILVREQFPHIRIFARARSRQHGVRPQGRRRHRHRARDLRLQPGVGGDGARGAGRDPGGGTRGGTTLPCA